MGWIVVLGRKNLFDDSVFPSRESAEYGLVSAIRAGSRKDAAKYIKAKVVKTKKEANVTK